jgi:PAS domain S-box-containing protein
MPQVDAAAGSVRDLRYCIRDLVALSTVPAIWIDSSARQIADGMAEALVGIFGLEFAYIVLRPRPDELLVEVSRTADDSLSDRTAAIRAGIADWLQSGPPSRDGQIRNPSGNGMIRMAFAPIGIGEDSVLVAACRRSDFPTEAEWALMGVAASLTAVLIQRWQAEQAMRESERRFRQFAENSTCVLWIINLETDQYDYLSPACEQLWGEPCDAMLRDRTLWVRSIHPDDRARALKALEGVIQGEVVVQEYRIIRPDGTVRWVRDTGFPMRDAQHIVRRVGGIAEDITKHEGSLVYLVSADGAVSQALSVVLQAAGYQVKPFTSATAFLEVAPVLVPGCVLVDIRMPEAGGIAIPRELKARRIRLPAIVMGDSYGDVGMAVQAMKAGAIDFLETPYDRKMLLAAIASALAEVRDETERDRAGDVARARIAGLSPREREVLHRLLAGATNKSIAKDLGISPRTVEIHRARVMERLSARTLPEAVLIAAAAGVQPLAPPENTILPPSQIDA